MAEVQKKAKKTKKNRKFGKNATFCARYRLERRGEKSQCNRIGKHLTRFPADMVAKKRHDELIRLLGW